MNVLFVTRGWFPETFGGPAAAIRQLGPRLIERGHSVTLYTSNLVSARKKVSSATWEDSFGGVRVVYFNSWVQYNYAAVTPGLIPYCRESIHQYDVVNVYGLREFMTLVTTFYANRASVPYVVQPVGNAPRYFRNALLKLVYDKLFGERLLAGSRYVVARSQLEASSLEELGVLPSKISVVPHGVTPPEGDPKRARGMLRRRLELDSDAPLLLYVGRLARSKSLHLLVEAVSDPRLQGVALALAGPDVDPRYVHHLHHLVRRRGLGPRVHFLGPVSGDLKLGAFLDADLYVQPAEFESFGLSVAEAMVCGLPSVVTTGCGLAPLVSEGAGRVTRPNPPALAEAIAELLFDRTALASCAQTALETAHTQLTWTRATELLEEILLTAADRSSNPALQPSAREA